MDKDIAYFVSWCIEEYKTLKGIDGASAMQLFDRHGILDYLADNYEVLHTQSPQWLMEEISLLLNKAQNNLSA